MESLLIQTACRQLFQPRQCGVAPEVAIAIQLLLRCRHDSYRDLTL